MLHEELKSQQPFQSGLQLCLVKSNSIRPSAERIQALGLLLVMARYTSQPIDMITPSRETDALPDIHRSNAGILLGGRGHRIPRAPSIGLGLRRAEEFAVQIQIRQEWKQ